MRARMWRDMERRLFWTRVFHFVFGRRPPVRQRECCWSASNEPHAPLCMGFR